VNTLLRIPSVTGIDLELKIAGPGARSYAFIIDWHIRLLAAVAWLSAATFLIARMHGAVSPGIRTFSLVSIVPSLAIYFLYHFVLEIIMHGRTPGKRMAGVRLVSRDGGVPGAGALLIRNIFRLVDSLPVVYCVGLATTMVNRESLRIGDIAAGTVLIYDAAPTDDVLQSLSARAVERLGLKQAEVVRDLLGRWNELMPDARDLLALRLLTKLGRAPADRDDAALRTALEGLLD
jgi:uncharacterized RDD family membrane protein YckC